MVSVAILGVGSIVQNRHLPAWEAQPDATVAAVADVRADVAQQVAAAHGIPRWTTDYRELLAEPTIEVVDVCLPHDLHAPVAIDCLRAGKHVLVEKPMAISLDETRAMARTAEEQGRVLMVAENWRYMPVTIEAARLVREGAIGEPFLLRAALEFDVKMVVGPEVWRLRREASGGGVLIDSGVHLLTVARWLMGEPTEVIAFRPKQVIAELAPSEDSIGLLVRFAGGGVGLLAFSWRGKHERAYSPFELLATGGTMSFDVETGALSLARGGAREDRSQPHARGFDEEVRHLLDCLRDGTRPRTAGLEEARTLALALAAYRSLQSGRPECVETV